MSGRSARSARALAALALALAAGCSVERDHLDTMLYTCGDSKECGDGWGCVSARPVTENFCAPLCDGTTCDGVCVGDEELCLSGCTIQEDGTTSECQSEDFACVRTSIERPQGVCYPAQKCEVHADCGEAGLCFGEILRERPEAIAGFDNFYCVPRPNDAGECPAGSRVFNANEIVDEIPIELQFCGATCSATQPGCPPGLACLTQFQFLGVDPYCIAAYGLACESDANCLVGRCIDTGTAQGKICTLTCNEASRLRGGCDRLVPDTTLLSLVYDMACDPTRPSDGSGLCVPRYQIGFPSCTDGAGAYPCADGLMCVQSGSAHFCSRPCTTDPDCAVTRPFPEGLSGYVCVDGTWCGFPRTSG